MLMSHLCDIGQIGACWKDYCRRKEEHAMKTPSIIAIVLCSAARFACAQDAATAGSDTTAAGGAAAGGHDVAVFTGVPSRSRSGTVDWSTPARGGYGRLDARSPFGDIEGFTLGRQY